MGRRSDGGAGIVARVDVEKARAFCKPSKWLWFPQRYQGRTDLEYPFIKVSDTNLPGNEVEISYAANTVNTATLNLLRARAYPPGTIIFPKIGGAIATNKKRVLSVDAVFDNNIIGVIPDKERLLVKWCFYYLSTVNLMDLAKIGPVPSIRQSVVLELPIPIPYPEDLARSLAEQHRIVMRLEALLGEVREMSALQAEIEADVGRLMEAVLAEVFAPKVMQAWQFEAALD